MARLARISPLGIAQHVIQRGNNRQVCFVCEQDFASYAAWLTDYAAEFRVQVHGWVFMTNHVHLLVTPLAENGVSKMMQALGRRYVRYFNRQYRRSGTLWEGRFKSSLVASEGYLLACQRYIELNPVRAGMVSDPAEYPWSSYKCHAFGVTSALHSPHEQYLRLACGQSNRLSLYRDLFRVAVEGSLLDDIRSAVNKGLALGNERFKQEIEVLYGRRLKPAKMGRPRKG